MSSIKTFERVSVPLLHPTPLLVDIFGFPGKWSVHGQLERTGRYGTLHRCSRPESTALEQQLWRHFPSLGLTKPNEHLSHEIGRNEGNNRSAQGARNGLK